MADGLTQGSLAGFSVQQEAAISVCDARREELVNNSLNFNKIIEMLMTPKKSWWQFWK